MMTDAFEASAPGTKLGALVGAFGEDYDYEIRLPAGSCALIHLVGVTPAELEKAKSMGRGTEGTQTLLKALHELGPGLVTDTARPCITEHPRFSEVWARASKG
jgi:hypothetical protein